MAACTRPFIACAGRTIAALSVFLVVSAGAALAQGKVRPMPAQNSTCPALKVSGPHAWTWVKAEAKASSLENNSDLECAVRLEHTNSAADITNHVFAIGDPFPAPAMIGGTGWTVSKAKITAGLQLTTIGCVYTVSRKVKGLTCYATGDKFDCKGSGSSPTDDADRTLGFVLNRA